jgi:tripartite-type tricarboxylate transporter receptor subunit TctC
MGTSGIIGANKALYRTLPFDPEKDLTPISQVAFVPNVLVVGPSVQARTLAEFIALAKASPGVFNYGTAGSGTSQHLAAALFAARAGIDVVQVSYRGGAPAVTDLIAGKIHFIMSPLIEVLPHIRSGALRPLGVTTRRRAGLLPEVATIADTMPGFEIALWNGIMGPANLPPAVLQRLGAEVSAAVRTPELNRKLAEQGSEPVGSTPAEFAAFIRTDIPKWLEVVRLSGATAE